jgi:DNA-binding CsgD family transcriptional regulator
VSETAALPLPGMPVPEELHRVESQGRVAVRRGGRVLFVHDSDDVGMRNLAVVAVTDAGVPVKEAARCFGITPTYVSMLRGRARDEGSAGLVKPMGRPPKLNARQREQARRWAGRGWTQQQIADRLSISRPQIGELIARHGVIPPQDELPCGIRESTENEPGSDAVPEPETEPGEGARIGTGTFASRYAGVMLGHAFLSRVGAGEVFAAMAARRGARFDDPALLCALTLCFGLGVSSVEQVKHLVRRQSGPVAGLVALPELRTLRPRLAAVADGCDPLAVQRELAAAMLRADAPALGVY